MAFFKKRKEEDVEEIKNIAESRKIPAEFLEETSEEIVTELPEKTELPQVKEEKPVPEVEEKRPAYAPLFVKIERYKSVLNTIADLKTTVIMIKNALEIQRNIESLRDENRRLLEAAISKIDKKIVMLDSEFLRPKGYEEEFPPPIYETESLEGAVTDLKKQVESLKSELQSIT
jgi:nitrogenase molybdenum-iron protein alpha/beta subunit